MLLKLALKSIKKQERVKNVLWYYEKIVQMKHKQHKNCEQKEKCMFCGIRESFIKEIVK